MYIRVKMINETTVYLSTIILLTSSTLK